MALTFVSPTTFIEPAVWAKTVAQLRRPARAIDLRRHLVLVIVGFEDKKSDSVSR
jgi:hypothetical protein